MEIDSETYEEESLGACKRVYKSLEGENVGIVSSRGSTFEEQALHTARIIHNEQIQRNSGITTATSYTPAKAEIDDQAYPALVGSFRDDLVTHGELDEMLEDKGFQEEFTGKSTNLSKNLRKKARLVPYRLTSLTSTTEITST